MDPDIIFRHSCPEEIEAIMEIYENAKAFMRSRGNFSQWNGPYPSADTILADMAAGHHYVAADGSGRLLAAFSCIPGKDPTYGYIEDGQWLNDGPYVTIHRIASSGQRRRMLDRCVEFCTGFAENIRMDTHADNRPMLEAATRAGFVRCGVIYLADGSPRTAFLKPCR